MSESVTGSGSVCGAKDAWAGWLVLEAEGVSDRVSEGPEKRLVVGSSGLNRPSRIAKRASSRLRAAGYRTSRL